MQFPRRRHALQAVARTWREKRAAAEGAPARKRLCGAPERSGGVGQWPASMHDRCGPGGDVRRDLWCGGRDRSVGPLVGGWWAGRRYWRHTRRLFCRGHDGPGRRCMHLRLGRCSRLIRQRIRRRGWYWLRRCGQRSVGIGVTEGGAQPVPQVGKRCRAVRDVRFGRHDLIDVLGEGGHHQIQGLGIAVLERCVENRTGLGAELREYLRGEEHVGVVEASRGCGAVLTASEQRREPARQEERERASGWRPARHTHPAGRGGSRLLRCGVVLAGLRDDRSPQGAGEVDAAANSAADRAADAADEARTNPLVGLGGKAWWVERNWHRGLG
jgi:hypothetical protein